MPISFCNLILFIVIVLHVSPYFEPDLMKPCRGHIKACSAMLSGASVFLRHEVGLSRPGVVSTPLSNSDTYQWRSPHCHLECSPSLDDTWPQGWDWVGGGEWDGGEMGDRNGKTVSWDDGDTESGGDKLERVLECYRCLGKLRMKRDILVRE